MIRIIVGMFVALAAVLAVVPLAGAWHTETVACCGKPPGQP